MLRIGVSPCTARGLGPPAPLFVPERFSSAIAQGTGRRGHPECLLKMQGNWRYQIPQLGYHRSYRSAGLADGALLDEKPRDGLGRYEVATRREEMIHPVSSKAGFIFSVDGWIAIANLRDLPPAVA